MTREDMRNTIFDKITDWTPYADAHDEKAAQERTDELLNALLPQVTTVEELEALPVGVVIVANNHTFLRIPSGWRVDGQQGIWRSEWLPSEGALTVVWQP